MTLQSLMTETRFRDILDAYGAEPRRWPEAERSAAVSYMLDHAARVQPWLEEARLTDGFLSALPASERQSLEDDSRSLHWRTLEQLALRMPEGKVVTLRPRRTTPVLWAAAGMAACIAGAVFGVNISLSTMGDLRAQSVLEQAQVFDDEARG